PAVRGPCQLPTSTTAQSSWPKWRSSHQSRSAPPPLPYATTKTPSPIPAREAAAANRPAVGSGWRPASGTDRSERSSSTSRNDASRAHTVARGVTVAGVEVGDLTEAKARARVARALVPRLERPLVLRFGPRRFVVDPQRAGLAVEVDRMVADAVALSRRGSLLERFARDVRGRSVDVALPLRAAYSTAAIQRFVRDVARKVDRPARSAEVVANAVAVRVRPSREGIAVRRDALAAELRRRLVDPRAARTLAVPTRVVRP